MDWALFKLYLIAFVVNYYRN